MRATSLPDADPDVKIFLQSLKFLCDQASKGRGLRSQEKTCLLKAFGELLKRLQKLWKP